MTNEQIWELMQRDLDDDLSPDEQMHLHSYIQSDPELQLMYGRLKRVSEQLEQLPPVTPAFSIVDSILPQLEVDARQSAASSAPNDLPRLEVKKEAATAETRKWKRLPLWMARAGSGVAAACLLLGLFFMVNGSSKDDPYRQGSELPPVVEEKPAVVTPPVTDTKPNHVQPSSGEPAKTVPKNSNGQSPGKSTPKPASNPKQQPPAKPQPTNKKPAAVTPPSWEEEKAPTFPFGLEVKPGTDEKKDNDADEDDKGKDRDDRDDDNRNKKDDDDGKKKDDKDGKKRN
jgi:hypothetical protein